MTKYTLDLTYHVTGDVEEEINRPTRVDFYSGFLGSYCEPPEDPEVEPWCSEVEKSIEKEYAEMGYTVKAELMESDSEILEIIEEKFYDERYADEDRIYDEWRDKQLEIAHRGHWE